MSYPSLEKYNEAFQNIKQTLSDPELQQGSLKLNGLGMPLALCGGFALTYTLTNGQKKYAVRCFHKKSSELEKRYDQISTFLKQINSIYFLPFNFQPKGINVQGLFYPIVKMSWAEGVTLGQFLDQNYNDKTKLSNLLLSITKLAQFLESKGIAHGDIQPGNVMVSEHGNKIQLIDYDGMYIPSLKNVGSTELGHRNFQHPSRSSQTWDSTLDRFSFILLIIVLRILLNNPKAWIDTKSDGDAFLFKANDYADPLTSDTFNSLKNCTSVTEDINIFQAICVSEYSKIPSLDEFLNRKNLPNINLAAIASKVATNVKKYLSAFPTMDASNYQMCLKSVGEKIELIGKIVEVKRGVTVNKKPYIFINFGNWRGQIVKLTIWSEGLDVLSQKPDETWVGKWLSVIGLMEPPYANKRYNYSHLSISISHSNQMHFISQDEAKFRLAGTSTRSAHNDNGGVKEVKNSEILNSINNVGNTTNKNQKTHAKRVSQAGLNNKLTSMGNQSQTKQSLSQNQSILQQIKNSAPKPAANSTVSKSIIQPKNYHPQNHQRNVSHNHQKNVKTTQSPDYCFIATAIYGTDAYETNKLRRWRDQYLLKTCYGSVFVYFYYKISPQLVPMIKKHRLLSIIIKAGLDIIVKKI